MSQLARYPTYAVAGVDGVVHLVNNRQEVWEALQSSRYVELWQVKTACAPSKADDDHQSRAAFLGKSATRLADVVVNGRVTCLRCLAAECDHGVTFDENIARVMTSNEVRSRYPRLEGTCPHGCGYHGIFYASRAHYVMGDW